MDPHPFTPGPNLDSDHGSVEEYKDDVRSSISDICGFAPAISNISVMYFQRDFCSPGG